MPPSRSKQPQHGDQVNNQNPGFGIRQGSLPKVTTVFPVPKAIDPENFVEILQQVFELFCSETSENKQRNVIYNLHGGGTDARRKRHLLWPSVSLANRHAIITVSPKSFWLSNRPVSCKIHRLHDV